jgi:hypothetical protein
MSSFWFHCRCFLKYYFDDGIKKDGAWSLR